MKKWTVLAASCLIALSTVTFAAHTNSNDVLQTIPGAQTNNKMMADAATTTDTQTTKKTTKKTKRKSTKCSAKQTS